MFRSMLRVFVPILILVFAFIPAVAGQTDPEATEEATAEATAEATPEVAPCLVRADVKDTVQVRVGPGQNRTAVTFLAAATDFVVQGQALADDDALWYQLDKAEAAPGKLVNEAWVAAAEVTTSGDCETVSAVAAPPIIPIAPASSSDADAIVVPGYASQWVDSGLTVEVGQTITIQASGSVNLWNTCDPQRYRSFGQGICSGLIVNPNGFRQAAFPNYPIQANALSFPRGTYGALIGRIGTGQPFVIGSYRSLTAEQAGSLYLLVNDWDYPDNVGSFSVRVTVE